VPTLSLNRRSLAKGQALVVIVVGQNLLSAHPVAATLLYTLAGATHDAPFYRQFQQLSQLERNSHA
jgi:hypothetical protein